RRPVPRRRPTDGPGSSSPPTPSSGWPDHSPPTYAARGRNPLRPNGFHPPESAAAFGTCARTPNAQPPHPNPPDQAQDGHPDNPTHAGQHATTSTSPPPRPAPRNQRRRRRRPSLAPDEQVKDQAR